MPDIVESDFAVSTRASAYTSTTLNSSGTVAQLFKNNVTPVPAFTAGSFTQATYTGYTNISLFGQWSSPAQVVPGQWQTQTGILTFPGCTSGSPETLYGVYVLDGSGNYIMAFLFASPVVMNPGDPPILTQLSYNFWARVLLP